MKGKELQMIVSNYFTISKDVVQSIHRSLFLLPIIGTLLRRGFSMSMVFLRHRLIAESEENPIRFLGTVSKSSDFWRLTSHDSEITELALLSAMHSAFGV